MHAVLVCSDKDEQFSDYPDVADDDNDDGNNEGVVTRDYDGNWVWKPQATATEIQKVFQIGCKAFPYTVDGNI